MDCCQKNIDKKKKCVRKDGKEFSLPRRFSQEKCLKEPVRGFTMRSSCAPYKFCMKSKKNNKNNKSKNNKNNKSNNNKKKKSKKPKQKGGTKLDKNMLGKKLKVCSLKPLTGFFRDGKCSTGENDFGKHFVCAKMDQKFLDFTASRGNDLSSVVKKGEKWCLCEERWLEAYQNKKAPQVDLEATNQKTRKYIKKLIRQKKYS